MEVNYIFLIILINIWENYIYLISRGFLILNFLIFPIGLLHKYMKNECMNYKYVYNSNYPVTKLATRLAESNK